jgi:hypothetical protein
MKPDYSHLAPHTADLLDGSDANRISAIREERWITYPRASRCLELLDSLLTRPRTTRMPSIAVYADSGMGKTMLMERFQRANPSAFNASKRQLIAPVVAMQMSSHPTERRFYSQLLHTIGVPFTPRSTLVELEIQALRNLKRMDVKLLMLDEVHNLLAGSAKEQRALLNLLRYLSNELQLSPVCLGVAEAREAVSGDVQLARRFEEFPLTRWQGNEEFQDLIVAILRHLPMKLKSHISARALRHVLQITDGLTAQIFKMFNDMALDAIKSGNECISDENIEAWRPSERYQPAFA